MLKNPSSFRYAIFTSILIALAAITTAAIGGKQFAFLVSVQEFFGATSQSWSQGNVQDGATMLAYGVNSTRAVAPPTLGNYSNTSVGLSGNATITPDAVPTSTTGISVTTTTKFVGELTADPATGVVRVTNAHHASIAPGSYLVTVKAIGPGGTATKTFDLTVTSGTACTGVFTFTNGNDVTVGPNTNSVAAADFNNDGKQDFASSSNNANTVSVRLGDGTGGFTGSTDIAVGTSPYAVKIGDFNNDGNQDFVTAAISSNALYVRLGNGAGGFTNAANVAVGTSPYYVIVGDFNNDGNDDLAASAALSNTVYVRLGNGSGGFTNAPDVPVGTTPLGIALGDFNNDGNQDFATAAQGANTVYIRLGNGSGGFTNAADVGLGSGTGSVEIAVGDFNNDGNQDFATGNETSGTVSVRLGTGSGTFTGTGTFANGPAARAITVADFNNDGKEDILFTRSGPSAALYMLGDGNGDFAAPVSLSITARPLGLAIGDLNADGKQDFLTANDTTGTVSVRLGACYLPPTLGNYTNTSIGLSGNTTITPSAPPTGTTSINVSSHTSLNGKLTADPVTGIVRITNAHPANIPAGNYTITVKASGLGGTATKTFALTVTSGSACITGTATFTGAPDIAVGPNTNQVAVADFNNDGKQDFASASNNANTVSVRLGDGAGGFTGITDVAVGTQPYGVKIGDFNNDGNQDFVTAAIGSNTLYVRLGNGLGGFTNAANVGVGTSPYYLTVGDFNNDGNDDLAATASGSNTVYVRLGNGAGGFTNAPDVAVGSGPLGIALGDFNNDGNQDFATAAQGSHTVYIRLGNGSGGFTNAADVAVGAGPVEIAVGDFNNDGKQDFATANESSGTVTVKLGTGTGTFTGSGNIANGPAARAIAIADINNDEKQDILFARSGSSAALYMLGDGAGFFTTPVSLPITARPLGLGIGDFNADGRQDFLTANDTSGTVSVRLGKCYIPSVGATPYRWQVFNTYDNGTGAWLMGNNPAMYGGVAPSNWTDNNAIAADMSDDPAVLATLITNKGYAGDNAMIWSEAATLFSSTNGRIVVTMFRVQNTTASPIAWTPNFYYSANNPWSERASVALNGNDIWNSGTFSGLGQTAVVIPIPANQTSTVIFTSASGPGNGLRASQFGFFNNTLQLPAGLNYVEDLPTPVPYRWQVFNTYDQNSGWMMGNNAAMYGGVNPSNWTDNNAIAADMSDDPAVLATLFTNKGYAGNNAMIWSEASPPYSSTNGRIVATLFRITNTTNGPITWTPSFYYSAYSGWSERASVALNGNDVWNSGTFDGLGQRSQAISIPANQTSSVIFTSASGPGSNTTARASQFGFYNNSLQLPPGLSYVEDLPTPVPYRWQVFNTYDNGTAAWLMGNNPAMYGGVAPSNWTDNNAIAADMSDDPAVLATLLTNKGYAGANAMIWSEASTFFSSTNGRIAVAMFRIQNTTGSPIFWTPNYYYSANFNWSERASVSLNGNDVWNSGSFSGIGQNALVLSIPANQTSTVIFTSTSGLENGLRATQLGFYNNSLLLPAGLSYVDDLNGTSPAPTVTTAAATPVGITTATLNGTANPNGSAGAGWFRYSTTNPITCNDSFGTRAPASGGSSLGAGISAVPYSQAMIGLSGATQYYYCAIAQNSGGTGFGLVQSFTTNAATYTLTAAVAGAGTGGVASLPEGIICPGDCSEVYNNGTPVSLTATPSGGSIFTGWSGDCSGLGVCDVTMSENRSVTATFVPAGTQFSLSGRALNAAGRPITNARFVITGNSLPVPRVFVAGRDGGFTFSGLLAGETYFVTVNQRRYTFSPSSQTIYLVGNRTDVIFVAD